MLSYALKNGPFILLGNGLLSVFTFITTLALTHLLPKETFGAWRYILAALSILAVCTLPDMGQALTRAVSKKQPVNLGPVVRHKIFYGLIGALASLGLSAYHLRYGNAELGVLFAIAALFIPFSDVFLIYVNVLHGVKKFGTAVAYDTSSRLIAMVLLLGAAFITKNIFVILPAWFLSNIIPQLYLFLKIRRKKLIGETAVADPAILSYGKHLTLLGGMAVLAANVDKFVIWHLLGAKALATYAVALLIAGEGARVAETLSVIILPYLSEARDQKNIRALLRLLPFFAGGLAAIGGVCAFLMPSVFPVIFPAYTDVLPLARMSFILLVLTPINSILYRYLVAEMWRKKMLLLHTLKIAAFSGAALVTIPRFGLMGGVLALIVSEALASGFLLFTIVGNIRKIEACPT